MNTNNNEINKVIDEIVDTLDRTYWVLELPKHPTKLQIFISRLFFKTEFKKIIKSKK